LVFANDSCYLMHPLAQTFATMAGRPCAWWGLQATKGMISTSHQNQIPEDAPLSIEEVKASHLSAFETDPIYDFHVGSYFLAFRKEVINDPGFRRVMDNVAQEDSKLRIIRKYEIGLSRFLIGKGYAFDPLVDTVTKQHAIFTERAFDLIDEGFPLLKRYFLTHNHYRVKGLAQWKSRLGQANPDADVGLFEKNLKRVGDALKLYDNFHIGQSPDLSRAPRSREVMRYVVVTDIAGEITHASRDHLVGSHFDRAFGGEPGRAITQTVDNLSEEGEDLIGSATTFGEHL
jgi:lipopolysaccharide biosynthesis protein